MAKNIKYLLQPTASGDLWAKAPDYERKDGARFVLGPDLSQKDLEYLFSQGYTDIVIKHEVEESKKAGKKPDEKDPG